MENASKALIMAGAILIAIMIISLSIFIFNNFGNMAKERANMDKEEIQAFNAKITPYLGTISGSQVNALLQYCLSVDISAMQTDSGDVNKFITVTYPGGTIDKNNYKTYNRVTGGSYYDVNGEADNNGLITTITITQK